MPHRHLTVQILNYMCFFVDPTHLKGETSAWDGLGAQVGTNWGSYWPLMPLTVDNVKIVDHCGSPC